MLGAAFGTKLAETPKIQTLTVMYDNVDAAAFDLDYDMAKHMPLVDATCPTSATKRRWL